MDGRFNFREHFSLAADLAHRDVGEATSRRRAEAACEAHMERVRGMTEAELCELVLSVPMKRSVA